MLFGVSLSKPLMMITQFHGIDGKCVTLKEASKSNIIKKSNDWVRIFKEIAEALQHVHDRGLLHNDVKSDNVIITDCFRPVLIDFGKSRKIENAKLYKLCKEEQLLYKNKY